MAQRAHDLLDVGSAARAALERALRAPAPETTFPTGATPSRLTGLPVSFTAPCDGLNIAQWLKRSKASPRVYWSSRDGDLEIGGLGAAQIIQEQQYASVGTGIGRIVSTLDAQPSNTHLRFLGGTRFYPEVHADGAWKEFPALWFVLPQFMITRSRGSYSLTAAVPWQHGRNLPDIAAELLRSYDLLFDDAKTVADTRIPCVVDRRDKPDRGGWIDGVRSALAEIRSDNLEKVVLARRSDLSLSAELDPFDFLEALKRAGRGCYVFLFEPSRGISFVGASPELLFRLEGDYFATEAVSGTTARGATLQEDKKYGAELLRSEKILREHRYVVEGIRDSLSPLCSEFSAANDLSVRKLPAVQHLVTSIHGKIRQPKSLGSILTSLHPTPAVCGTPARQALQFLTRLEGFDRGWYAAPVGMISHQAAEMAVAIRSGVIVGNRISLFAGAGIVAGSDPESEWGELEQKISTSIAIFSGAKD